MDDLSEKLNQVLNDPDQMAKIMELAGKLGGTPSPDAPPLSETMFEPEQISKVLSMMNHCSNEEGLLKALRPYLPPEKAEKMSRAIRYAKLSKIVSRVLQEQRQG